MRQRIHQRRRRQYETYDLRAYPPRKTTTYDNNAVPGSKIICDSGSVVLLMRNNASCRVKFQRGKLG
jgi:hypothetical protein